MNDLVDGLKRKGVEVQVSKSAGRGRGSVVLKSEKRGEGRGRTTSVATRTSGEIRSEIATRDQLGNEGSVRDGVRTSTDGLEGIDAGGAAIRRRGECRRGGDEGMRVRGDPLRVKKGQQGRWSGEKGLIVDIREEDDTPGSPVG